jgi:hypothetical protein
MMASWRSNTAQGLKLRIGIEGFLHTPSQRTENEENDKLEANPKCRSESCIATGHRVPRTT